MEHTEYVVDASVGVKLVVREDSSDIAELFFASIAQVPEGSLFVPDLFYAECANVLWKYVRRSGCGRKNAYDDLASLYDLSLVAIPTPALTPTAFGLAVELSISVYDACYVAASDLVGAPLVTADMRLLSRLSDTGCQAISLEELAL